MFKIKLYLFLLLTFLFSSITRAGEEALDLDSETVKVVAPAQPATRFSIMGRVDLTYEVTNPDPDTTPQGSDKSALKNYHFFVFIKVKASPKVNFMGEVVQQKFYFIDYTSSLLNLQFGKILVPFGDTRHFHHLYGGIDNYGSTAVMFPNIWAEPGVNLKWNLPIGELDTYMVNSIAASDATSDPSLTNDSETQQAYGLRFSFSPVHGLNAIASGYSGDYWASKKIYLYGLDLYSDYGAVNLPVLKNFKFAAGFANADIKKAPVSGDFSKKGDYLEIDNTLLPVGEIRVRYGTYINNNKTETDKDVHNINLGYQFDVDVIHLLFEKQWNYEAVNEHNNDVFRIMASLDF